MNANSLPKTPTINAWLAEATIQLRQAGIDSARLDAEIILAHTLRKDRIYIHAHDDETLTDRQLEIANARLTLRLERTPIAYIVGHKAFYGRLFRVTPDTLIPRPESETIITLLNEHTKQSTFSTPTRLVDVGTGSGCLGITAKLEHPDFDVTLIDVSNYALKVAEGNAKSLHAPVTLLKSNLLHEYPFEADLIIANLPYVDKRWARSPETAYEPAGALFADEDGLALINQLIEQAADRLAPSGLLFLEADPRQHTAITHTAKHYKFEIKEIRNFIICLKKA